MGLNSNGRNPQRNKANPPNHSSLTHRAVLLSICTRQKRNPGNGRSRAGLKPRSRRFQKNKTKNQELKFSRRRRIDVSVQFEIKDAIVRRPLLLVGRRPDEGHVDSVSGSDENILKRLWLQFLAMCQTEERVWGVQTKGGRKRHGGGGGGTLSCDQKRFVSNTLL